MFIYIEWSVGTQRLTRPLRSLVPSSYIAHQHLSESFRQALHHIILPTALFLDTVLWFVLVPQAQKVDDACQSKASAAEVAALTNAHSWQVQFGNAVCILIDTCFTRLEFNMYMLPFQLLYLLTYSFYGIFMRHLGYGWSYFFQDTSNPDDILWYMALMVLAILYFMLAFSIHQCKKTALCNQNPRLANSEMVGRSGFGGRVSYFHRPSSGMPMSPFNSKDQSAEEGRPLSASQYPQ
jgi:hypothetical protein